MKRENKTFCKMTVRNVQGNLVITDANKKEAWIEHHERLLNIELSMVCWGFTNCQACCWSANHLLHLRWRLRIYQLQACYTWDGGWGFTNFKPVAGPPMHLRWRLRIYQLQACCWSANHVLHLRWRLRIYQHQACCTWDGGCGYKWDAVWSYGWKGNNWCNFHCATTSRETRLPSLTWKMPSTRSTGMASQYNQGNVCQIQE